MLCLCFWYRVFFSGLVNMSAFYSVVGMRDTLILPVCTVSWKKWYRTSMHFLLRVDPVFFAICTAAVLSMCRTGWRVGMVVSLIILAIHMVRVAVSAAAMYSASQVLLATIGCWRESHCTGEPLSSVMVPVTDLRVVSSFA